MDKTIPVLFQNKADCCGCGACRSRCPKQAISMQEDDCGFVYPHIDESLCIGCGSCAAACAFRKSEVTNRPLAAFAAMAADRRLAKKSASGGVFAALAKKVLSEGGAVVGAALQRDFSVAHEVVQTEAELPRLQGSKYTQSAVGQTYAQTKQLLAQGRTVLFSGTPCQVDGLYGYLGKKPGNLITVDIICHGVPSNRMLQDSLRCLSEKLGGEITDFCFRDKEIGWGKNGSAVVHGKKHKIWESTSAYFYYFSKGWLFRENCYGCKYACAHRPADLTLGDFWGIEKHHPDYLGKNGWDEAEGISVAIANTEKGKSFLESAKDVLLCKPSDFAKAAAGNAQLNAPSKRGNRDAVVELYRTGGWEAVEQRYKKNIGWRYYSSRLKAALPKGLKRKLKSLK